VKVARIEKQGDTVTLTMDIREAIMLNEIIDQAGNLCARLRRKSGDNRIVYRDAELAMKQLWSLSDHLSTPTETGHSYTQDFNLP
jgi:hypothetical protein